MRKKEEIDAAFDALYRENGDYVFRMCVLYLGEAEPARDAAQETFYKVYKGLHGFRRQADVRTWITRIAINVCKDVMRKRKDVSYEEIQEASVSEERDSRLSVREAIEKLSPKLREVVILYYYREMKQKEIAQILGIGEAAVAKRLERARTELREVLGEDFCE